MSTRMADYRLGEVTEADEQALLRLIDNYAGKTLTPSRVKSLKERFGYYRAHLWQLKRLAVDLEEVINERD